MKTKAILIIPAVLAVWVSYLDLSAQTPNTSPPSQGTKLAYPYGQECVLTLDPQASKVIPQSVQPENSGFQPDGTLRGQLIYLSDEWCVLKDGTFENWIPREKVLMMRVSK